MTAPLSFQVSTRVSGRRRTVTVKVYEDLEHLRTAARLYTRRAGVHQEDEFVDAVGVTHTSQRVYVGPDGKQKRGEAAAIIRLWHERLGTSVVVHEAVHAALGIYEQDRLAEHGTVHDGMDNEEILAYLIGDLTRRIVDRLYHYGAYTTPEGKTTSEAA